MLQRRRSPRDPYRIDGGEEVSYETQYLSIMNDLLTVGEYVEDRTGTGCYSLIGVSMEVDLEEGFPILTTKKVNFENIVGELLFFLSGKSDLKTLRHYSNKPEGSHTIWSDDLRSSGKLLYVNLITMSIMKP